MSFEPVCAGLHITAKPIGARCNLACEYCFYSEKSALYPGERDWRMDDALLERFVAEYIRSQPGEPIQFLWQGGEPMLMGLDFFRRAVSLQRRHAGGRRVSNSIQTNGTLIDEAWARFFRQEGFLVGVSLDGPAELHDRWRRTRSGRPSHESVMRGVELLKRHGVSFNVLCCVSAASAGRGAEVYGWFREQGLRYLQFAPVTESVPAPEEAAAGLRHAEPREGAGRPQPFSVAPEDYGQFLCDVFDAWAARDVGEVFVMNVEWALERWMGLPAGYCLFAPSCGKALALEHNGDVYACDHFVYPDWRLGNLRDSSCAELLQTPRSEAFRRKKGDLPPSCRACEYLFACNGECPKNRVLPGGENILCPAYRRYFAHIAPTMEKLVKLLKSGRPATDILHK